DRPAGALGPVVTDEDRAAHAGARAACQPSLTLSRPDSSSSRATRYLKTNPPTWAKNATPPPLAVADKIPKLASITWQRNKAQRKYQAGIRNGNAKKSVRIREFG